MSFAQFIINQDQMKIHYECTKNLCMILDRVKSHYNLITLTQVRYKQKGIQRK